MNLFQPYVLSGAIKKLNMDRPYILKSYLNNSKNEFITKMNMISAIYKCSNEE